MLRPNTHDNDGISIRVLLAVAGVLLGLLALTLVVLIALVTGLPVAGLMGKAFDSLFAASSAQALWYVTRAAGLMAYLLVWLATAYGLAVSSKILEPVLHGTFTYDLHEFLSLLAIGFVALHVLVLPFDRYLPFSVAAILAPFLAPYRPLWVGLGVIGFYLTLLVTVTFYMRKRIGMRAFRVIHLLSFISYGLAAIHGLMAGADSALPAAQFMYASTTLVIVFLTVYWVVLLRLNKQPQKLVENTQRI